MIVLPGIEEGPDQCHGSGEHLTDTVELLKAGSAEMDVEGEGKRREKRKWPSDL